MYNVRALHVCTYIHEARGCAKRSFYASVGRQGPRARHVSGYCKSLPVPLSNQTDPARIDPRPTPLSRMLCGKKNFFQSPVKRVFLLEIDYAIFAKLTKKFSKTFFLEITIKYYFVRDIGMFLLYTYSFAGIIPRNSNNLKIIGTEMAFHMQRPDKITGQPR